MLFCKTSQASLLYKSLAYSLMSFISGLWRVSLAGYLLVLRALFPLLLQMVRCTMGIASTVCIRRWATIRTKGNSHSVRLISCFCGLWLPAGTVSELSVCGFKTTCFRYIKLNSCCNSFLFWTPMYSTLVANFMYHVTVAAKSVRSWLDVGWFEILRDFTESRVVRA
jgi:hypothetical protein